MNQPDLLPDLLIVAPMMPPVMDVLERDFQTHRLWEAPDRAAFLKEVGGRVRAVATNGGAGLPREVMDALSALEVVVIYGVGLDAIDLAQCARRGIAVSNTPDVLTADVADQGLGLGLAWFHTGRLNLGMPHTLLGLSAVALGWLQIIWGVRRGSKGGPTDPAGMRGDHYDMTPHRRVFEWVHRGGGYLALLLALAAAWSGLRLVNAPGWAFGALLLFPLLFAAAFWLLSRQRWRVTSSYAAIWGPDTPQPGMRLTASPVRASQAPDWIAGTLLTAWVWY